MENQNNEQILPPGNTGQAKDSKHKSKAKRARDKQRQENNRRVTGEKVMADLQKELDKRLYFGFADEVKAASAQIIEMTEQAKIIPVSTRGIGFFSQSIFIKLYQTLKNIPQCSVYELYRFTLAQLEVKLINTQRAQIMPYPNADALYYRPQADIDLREIVQGTAVNFGPLANIVNAIGQFSYADTMYYPRLPRVNVMEPQAHLVTYGTLRQIVLALSNRATPQHVRMRFYQSNPLPGARWGPALALGQRRRPDQEVHPDFPLLQNPDEIMPDGYTTEDLEQDANRIKNLLGFCARKSVKYVDNQSMLNFTPTAPGCHSLLMSNYHTDGLRNPDVVTITQREMTTIDYANMLLPTGPLNEFWSDVKLDSNHALFGILQLLGEVPPEGLPAEVYGVRTLEHARQRISHRWSAISGNMLA